MVVAIVQTHSQVSRQRLTKDNWASRSGAVRLEPMKQNVLRFLNDDQGQDLIEYTLLMAFVALASAALFLGAGGSIKGIWTAVNTQLAAANTSAS